VADPITQPSSSLQRNQRAPAVPDQRRLFESKRVQQCGHRVGSLFHAGWRFAAAAAVAGQVDGQHIPAVVGQGAGLQDPHTVVVQHAVNEHGGGLCGVEGFAAGVGIQRLSVECNIHHAPALSVAFSAAFSARFRSSVKSSGSSSPMDRRMVPGPIPPAAKASSLTRKWVVLAG